MGSPGSDAVAGGTDPVVAVGSPPTDAIPLPGDERGDQRRLPRRAVTYWRTWSLIVGVPLAAIVVVGALLLPWPGSVRWPLAIVLLVYLLVIEPFVVPALRWRLFWYAISDDEVDVQHGWLTRTRTVIPMSRVQHLDTRSGPLADRFRLASIDIHTAAGKVEMEGLDSGEAEELRRRIGALAQLADDV